MGTTSGNIMEVRVFDIAITDNNDNRHLISLTAKAAFNRKKTLFTSKLGLELRKKLATCYIWSIALYGAETWTWA
jgi:hypothetical protein